MVDQEAVQCAIHMLQGLNKLEGKGCGIPNSSGLKKLSRISSLRLLSRLVGREFVGVEGGSVLGVVPRP